MMKRKMFFWAMAVAAAAMASSCDIETSDNGDLDGIWQLTSVDSLKAGMKPAGAHADMRMSGITWSFQGRLLEMRTLGVGEEAKVESGIFYSREVVCRFQHDNDILTLGPFLLADRENEDPVVTDMTLLNSYGINAPQEKFYVVRLKAGTMVLQSSLLELGFRKL